MMPGQTQPEPYHYGRSTAHDDLQATLLHWLANQSGRAAWGEIDLDGARADAYAVEIVRRKLVNPHIRLHRGNAHREVAEIPALVLPFRFRHPGRPL